LRFQRALKTLNKNGTLLAICSNNDERAALNAIEDHPDMLLRPGDFVTYRINTHDTSENVRSIAAELRLESSDFAFFDPSPIERQLMRRLIPEVGVIEVPTDPSEYVSTLAEYRGFDVLVGAPQELGGSGTHEGGASRPTPVESQSLGSLEDFLRSLQMTAQVDQLKHATLERFHQLLSRTHQFNLSAKRYEEPELRAMIGSATFAIMTVRLSDRLGESGLVGAVILRKDARLWEIENLLLNCRVIGRTVEYGLLRHIAENARASGAQELVASFVPTARNRVAAEFLSRAGFRKDETGKWRLLLDQAEDGIPKSFVAIQTPF
jgi:FkbH-like protein